MQKEKGVPTDKQWERKIRYCRTFDDAKAVVEEFLEMKTKYSLKYIEEKVMPVFDAKMKELKNPKNSFFLVKKGTLSSFKKEFDKYYPMIKAAISKVKKESGVKDLFVVFNPKESIYHIYEAKL